MASFKSLFQRPPPSSPWRTVPPGDRKSYLENIEKFQLNKYEVQYIRVLLYGPPGAGKSSFINTVETALRETMTCQASTDAIGGTSFTTKCETHAIEKGNGNYYPFVFVDVMGLERARKRGVCPEDVELVLKGHVKDGYTFNPESPITSSDPYYNSDPTLKDQIHVLVCVIPASTANLLTDENMEKIREIRCAARDLGIPQLAILTKIDVACPEVDSNINKVFLSSIIKESTEKVYMSVGIQPNCIFPVKNYHSELVTNEDIDKLALMTVKRIIDAGKDYVSKKLTKL